MFRRMIVPTRTILRFAIETEAEADAQRDKLVDRLASSSPARKVIAACDADNPCGLSSCPLCCHRFREYALPQLALLFDQPLDQLRFVTMYVQAVAGGKLAEVDALTLRNSLQKIIARADIPGRGLAVGALEPEWCAAEQKWLLHLHVITSEVDDKCWDRVRAVLRKRANKELLQATRSQARRVLRDDAVKNLADQLSYCIKFVTYDRLPRGDNGAKGKAVSLKGKPLDELVEWRSRYSPGDFLFLYGAKRLNGRFVRMLRSE
jgi:hypothetical protein